MTKNVEIIVEQCDNGIVLRWNDLDGEGVENIVALNSSRNMEIGKTIVEDIDFIMKEELCDKVKLTIKYESI